MSNFISCMQLLYHMPAQEASFQLLWCIALQCGSCYIDICINFFQATDPAAKGKPQLDLLNFEDLSIDPASSSPMPAATPSSNGTPAKPTEPTDYFSRCHTPAFNILPSPQFKQTFGRVTASAGPSCLRLDLRTFIVKVAGETGISCWLKGGTCLCSQQCVICMSGLSHVANGIPTWELQITLLVCTEVVIFSKLRCAALVMSPVRRPPNQAALQWPLILSRNRGCWRCNVQQ